MGFEIKQSTTWGQLADLVGCGLFFFSADFEHPKRTQGRSKSPSIVWRMLLAASSTCKTRISTSASSLSIGLILVTFWSHQPCA